MTANPPPLQDPVPPPKDLLGNALDPSTTDDLFAGGQFVTSPGGGSNSYIPSLMDNVFYGLQIPEEYTAKLIGSMFSNDPKYNFSSGKVNEQVLFSDVFRDLGVDSILESAVDDGSEKGTTNLPLVSSVLGFIAAVVNPIDYLNKAKLFGLSRRGILAEKFTHLNKIGGLVRKNGKLFLSEGKLQELLKQSSKFIAGREGTKLQRKVAKANKKRAQDGLRNRGKLNDILAKAQKAGNIDLSEFTLAPTAFLQAQRGQRKLLGFTNPLSLEHIPGLGKGVTDRAVMDISGAVGLGRLTRSMDAALIKGIGGPLGEIGKFVKNITLGAQEAMGFKVRRSAALKALQLKIDPILQTSRVLDPRELQARILDGLRSVVKEGVVAEDLKAVINALETPDEFVGVGTVIERQLLQTVLNDNFKSLKKLEIEVGKKPTPFGPPTDTVPGRNARDDALLLRASNLDTDRDLIPALGTFTNSQLPKASPGGRDTVISQRFIVTQGNINAPFPTSKQLKSLEQIDGVATFVKVTRGNDTFIIATKPTLGSRMLTPNSDPAQATGVAGVFFNEAHAENLEIIASELATKHMSIVGLEASDLLLTEAGGVLIINPNVIQHRVKGLKAAREASREVLKDFSSTYAAFPDPSNEFRHLNSNTAARRAAKDARKMKRLNRSATVLDKSGEGLIDANVYDVLEQAINTSLHRQLLRAAFDNISPQDAVKAFGNLNDVAVANNVVSWQQKIARDLAAGRQPAIPPIMLGVDELGNLTIVDGRDRLLGAILNDVTTVPIQRTDIVGDFLDTSTYIAGPSHDLRDLFQIAGDTAARGIPDLVQGGFIDGSYKLTTLNGSRRMLSPDILEVPSLVTDVVGRFMGLRAQGNIVSRAALLDQAVVQAFGSPGKAAAALATIIEESTSYVDFAGKMSDITKFDITDLLGRDVQSVAVNMFEKELRAVAQQHLDTLASRGAFRTKDLRDPLRMALFEGTIEHFEDVSNSLRIINSKKTVADLERYAAELLAKDVPVADIIPLQRISLEAGDDSVIREVKQFVGDGQAHPALRKGLKIHRKIAITDEKIQELRQKDVLYNPDKEMMASTGKFDPDTGRTVVQTEDAKKFGLAEFDRFRLTYFLTESGQAFVGTAERHRGYQELLKDIFGEGAVSSGDLALVAPSGILIQYPLGVRMTSLSKGNVLELQKRLVTHAKALEKMGVNLDLPVRIKTQFDSSVWEKIYGGEKRSIKSILSDSFELKIPENLVNMPLDTVIEAPHASIEIRRSRDGLTAKRQKIFDIIENELDDTFRREMVASLDIRFSEAHYTRVNSPAAEKARKLLNQGFDDIVKSKKNKMLVARIARFQKKRVFTDLSTVSINELTQEIRTLKVQGMDPDTIYKQVKDRVKSKKNFAGFQAMADALDETGAELGVTWFEENPLIAVAVRVTEGSKTIGQRRIIDTIADTKGTAAFSGTAEEYLGMKGLSKDSTQFDKDIKKLKKRRDEIKAQVRSIEAESSQAGQVTGVWDELNLERVAIDEKLGELGVKKDDLKAALIDKHGTVSHSLALDTPDLFIEGSVARHLLESGALKEADLLSDAGEELVRVPTSKILDKLGAEDRVIVFHDEVKPLIEKYFSTTRKANGQWDKFVSAWDKVQGTWKQYVLFPIPAFHVRNGLTDFFLSWLAGVESVQPYDDAIKTMALIRKRGRGTMSFEEVARVLDETKVVTLDGNIASMRDVYSEFVRQGGVGAGLEYNEFMNFTNSNVRRKMQDVAAAGGILPTSLIQTSFLNDNKLIRNTRNFSTQTSEHFRLAVFIDTFQKTGDFKKAGLNMKAGLYDYQDMNQFEREVLKRVFPFYSWVRKNIPRMMKTMVTEPIKHFRVAQFVNNWERGVNEGRPLPDEEILPWLQQFGIFPTKGRDGSYHFRGGEALIPTYDVFKMFSDPGRLFVDGLSPILKEPIKQLTNKNLRTGRPITDVEGQIAKSHTLGALGFNRRTEDLFRTAFRVGATVSDLIDRIFFDNNGRDVAPGLANILIDIAIGKGIVNDPEKAIKVNAAKRKFVRSKIQILINRAKKQGDVPATRNAELLLLQYDLRQPSNPIGK